MATIKMINGKAEQTYKTHLSMRRVIDYIKQVPEKTLPQYIKGFNCNPDTAYQEFLLNKQNWNKDKEDGKNRMVIHFAQSFAPDDPLNADMASEIAEKLLQEPIFKGFKIVYATHLDKDYLHNHFVLDTVNEETGLKWQLSRDQLENVLKKASDRLCEEYGLSIVKKDPTQPKKRYKTQGEMRAEAKGESYVKETQLAVDACMKVSISKAQFIYKMKELGYNVNWQDERKYITFERNGQKVRNKRFDNAENYTKEALDNQLELNKQFKEAAKSNSDIAASFNEVESLIKIAAKNSKNNKYPFQSMRINKTDSKAAKTEREKERAKGSGFDWEV